MGNFLEKNLHAKTFEALKIPFVCTLVQFHTGTLVPFESGTLIDPIRASCSFPLFFSPVSLGHELFVDGGVIDPLPVTIAQKYQPEYIIASNLSGYIPVVGKIKRTLILERSYEIGFHHHCLVSAKLADCHILPQINGGYSFFDDKKQDHYYEEGKKAAEREIDQILGDLKKLKIL